MLKKTFAVLGTLALALTLASCGEKARTDADLIKDGWVKNPTEQGYVKNPAENGWVEAPKALPAPQDTTKTYTAKVDGKDVVKGCEVGNYDFACSSINQTNLADYMNRDDVVYIDLRGIDNGYLGQHIHGFEPVEFFNFMWGEGDQLFKGDFTPRYEESVGLLNKYFPKDKTLFLMCQSGGRVVKMMQLLEAQGYDMTKVYNVGGFNQLGNKDSSVYKSAVNTGLAKVEGFDYGLKKLTPIAPAK